MMNLTHINELLSDAEKANREDRLAKHGSGAGGTPPSGFEARIARLEASVEHIESDIHDIKADIKDLRIDIKDLRKADESNSRILFSAIIAVALGLAGLMAKGFGWL